jgi:hypothetical protein
MNGTNELLQANEALYKKVQSLSDAKRTLRSALYELKSPKGCYCPINSNDLTSGLHTGVCKNALLALEKIK